MKPSSRNRTSANDRTPSQDPIVGSRGAMDAARFMRLLIRLAAVSLPLAFGWLKLRGVNFAPIAKDLSSDLIFRLTLALYYICWVAGLHSDVSDQERVFVASPDRRHVRIGGIPIAALITVMFGVLCYVESYKEFAVFLAIFLTINVLSWLYLVKKALASANHGSEQYYRREGRYFELEQLRLVFAWYLCGNWQWARFAFGAVIVGVINLLAFENHSIMLTSTLQHYSKDLIMSLSILCFVLAMEVWIWLKRLRVKGGLRSLDELRAAYKLTPIRA